MFELLNKYPYFTFNYACLAGKAGRFSNIVPKNAL